ncbi:RnfH family protein [Duganella sp.]|uniref:RnfH family protein n=1 Tax=Duganella sp. TaxID=1904440 RepID=UPI0031D4E140
MAAETIPIQVCYASDTLQFLRALQVPVGTTLEQAVALSALAAELPGVDVNTLETGIYAKKKPRDTILREHDRIELYRPLIADPKHARRRRKTPASG